MHKTLISFEAWKKLEPVLMQHRIGYEVQFDDHNGTAEMLIDIQPIGIYRSETFAMNEEADYLPYGSVMESIYKADLEECGYDVEEISEAEYLADCGKE